MVDNMTNISVFEMLTVILTRRATMITQSSWWGIQDYRNVEELRPKENQQLFPETYSAAPSLTLASFEDYRRVVFSIPYRSLKDKTQVFPLENESYVRTRLTHSQEVAMNASRIFLEVMSRSVEPNRRSARSTKSQTRDGDCPGTIGSALGEDGQSLHYSLIAACLLHDVGNPPFGHFGEQAIREWFEKREEEVKAERANIKACLSSNPDDIACKFGDRWLNEQKYALDLKCYEGNANSLRVALRGSELFDGRRFNFTATTLGALIKYPYTSETWHSQNADKGLDRAKFNYFVSDYPLIQSLSSRGKQYSYIDGQRHPLSYIMEMADDISYVTADFEDAFRRGCFSISDVLRFIVSSLQNDEKAGAKACPPFTFTLLCELALIAGSERDIDILINYYESLGVDSKYKANLKNNRVFDFARKDLKANSSIDALIDGNHTFSKAAERLSLAGNVSDQSFRQLQETYVTRWADIVRRWLCFTVAQNFSADEFVSDVAKVEPITNVENRLLGSHEATVDLLKSVMRHYVYESNSNTKMNLQARTVIHGLLDRLIPCVIKCTDLLHLDGLDPVNRALLNLIPTSIRMDCSERSAGLKDASRLEYERIMAVLDFISGMTDSQITQLYQDLS